MKSLLYFTFFIKLTSLNAQYCPSTGCDDIGNSSRNSNRPTYHYNQSSFKEGQIITSKSNLSAVGYLFKSCEEVTNSYYEQEEEKLLEKFEKKAVRHCLPNNLKDIEKLDSIERCERYYCGWGCQAIYAGVQIKARFFCETVK